MSGGRPFYGAAGLFGRMQWYWKCFGSSVLLKHCCLWASFSFTLAYGTCSSRGDHTTRGTHRHSALLLDEKLPWQWKKRCWPEHPPRVALLGSIQLLPSHATAMTQPLGGWNAPERATSLPYILGYEDVKLYTKFYSLKEKKKKKSTLTQQIYLGLRSTEVLAKVWLSQLQSPMLAHLIQNSALGLCPSGSCH